MISIAAQNSFSFERGFVMTVDIASQSAQLLAGAFLARATYGGEYIAPAFNVGGDNDAEKQDDYRGYVESQWNWQVLDASDLPTFNGRGGDARFTANGLYDARVEAGTTNSFDAQGLLAVKDGNTLVLAFRGTDGMDPAVEDGQAFTGYAIAANYKAFRPLINAAYDYMAAHPEITDLVVSGHSLGGAMADVFALKDAARFRELRPDGVTIVSLGSSGVPPDLPVFMGGLDPDAAVVLKKTIEIAPFITIKVPYIDSLILPADYISISNTEDRVHFPNNYPDVPEAPGLAPILTLKSNLQFGGDLLFNLPNIDNTDVQYHDVIEHPFDFRGMGAEHNSALLWTNLQGLVNDGLFKNYLNHSIIIGVTDYNTVPDFNGTPIALFEGYIDLDNPSDANDRGARTLTGTARGDYILGLSGHDRLSGLAGNDLLSGGDGDDVLLGGDGRDILLGGMGTDTLFGGFGADRFVFTDVAESVRGSARDVIREFSIAEGDRINLRAIDAMESVVGNQEFTFIGQAGFTGEGQIRAIQSGADTIVRINTAGAGNPEMEILLRNVIATTLTGDHFIL